MAKGQKSIFTIPKLEGVEDAVAVESMLVEVLPILLDTRADTIENPAHPLGYLSFNMATGYWINSAILRVAMPRPQMVPLRLVRHVLIKPLYLAFSEALQNLYFIFAKRLISSSLRHSSTVTLHTQRPLLFWLRGE